jgi:Na+-translocating ferredoxin:NAD+ oxidoreductase RnfC subunit
MHLAPVLLYQAARKQDWSRLPALHPQDCIQCGCALFYFMHGGLG